MVTLWRQGETGQIDPGIIMIQIRRLKYAAFDFQLHINIRRKSWMLSVLERRESYFLSKDRNKYKHLAYKNSVTDHQMKYKFSRDGL